jgi:hypothetical protein
MESMSFRKADSVSALFESSSFVTSPMSYLMVRASAKSVLSCKDEWT